MSAFPPQPDLTQRAPRSPRVRLGGYVILPRMLDKGRAKLAEKLGEFHYNCPLDQRFLTFVGIDPDALLEQLKLGKGDGEVLEWVNTTSTTKRHDAEIKQWGLFVESNTPAGLEEMEYFCGMLAANSKTRPDIRGWFDMIDLDDFVTFGGKA
jgi:hypothetical protein